jgi:drug/metabolite transporter (DMT)-like permease
MIGAALAWSVGGLLIKVIDLDGLPLAGARSGIAAIPIGLWLRYGPRPPGGDRVGGRLTPPVIAGSIAYAGTVILFVMATKQTTAANAILLQYTAPVWVALLSPLLLKESIGRIDVAAIALTLLGMAIFFTDDVSTTARFGDLLGIASGIFFAGCILALRYGRAGAGGWMVFYGNVLAALVGLPFLYGVSIPAGDLAPLFGLGVVQLGLGYILFMLGIRHVSAVEGGLIPVIEPILNPLWVLLAIGERPSLYSILGGGIVLLAVGGRALLLGRRIRQVSVDPL